MAREPEECVFWELGTGGVEQRRKRKGADLRANRHMADKGKSKVFTAIERSGVRVGVGKKACTLSLATRQSLVTSVSTV